MFTVRKDHAAHIYIIHGKQIVQNDYDRYRTTTPSILYQNLGASNRTPVQTRQDNKHCGRVLRNVERGL